MHIATHNQGKIRIRAIGWFKMHDVFRYWLPGHFWEGLYVFETINQGPPQVKCQLLISSIFDAMNF